MDENPKTPTPVEGTIAEPASDEPARGIAAGEEAVPADIDISRCASILESLLLVSDQPLSFEKAGQVLGGLPKAAVREAVRTLQAKYPPGSSGILVEEVARGIQFRTNPANQEHIRRLFDIKPPRFSRAALETLSIIAYKQPVTRLEMEQIRGVDCAGALKTLMERRLVKVVGKKDVIGRPFLFGTTREFMEVFGLASLSDLPSMRDIEDFLAAASGVAPGPAPEAREEAEHGEPLVTSDSGLTEGVSDDGHAAAGVPRAIHVPAKERPARSTPRRRATSELAQSLEDALHGEPLVTAEPGLPAGVSDDVLAEAASLEEGGEAAASGPDDAGEEPDGR